MTRELLELISQDWLRDYLDSLLPKDVDCVYASLRLRLDRFEDEEVRIVGLTAGSLVWVAAVRAADTNEWDTEVAAVPLSRIEGVLVKEHHYHAVGSSDPPTRHKIRVTIRLAPFKNGGDYFGVLPQVIELPFDRQNDLPGGSSVADDAAETFGRMLLARFGAPAV